MFFQEISKIVCVQLLFRQAVILNLFAYFSDFFGQDPGLTGGVHRPF